MMPTTTVQRAVKVLLLFFFFFFFSLTTTFVFADDDIENNSTMLDLMNSKNEAAHQLPLITTTTEKEEDKDKEEEEREAEVGKREKRDDERGEGETKKTFNIFSGPAYQGCCPNSSSLLSCCEEEGGCCSKTGTTGTLLDCCFSNPMDEVDLTEDKEEEERKEKTNPEKEGAQLETTLTNQQNDGDISEDEREDVESLVEATTYWPGGNRRFTWENLNVPMPSAVKKIIAERKETEEDQEEEKVVQEEINTAAPTGQVEGEEEETRKTFKTLLDISSFKMSKNEVLQGALGFGIFVIVASYIVGATYTREDGREISGNARGWSGVRQERESLYDSAFKAYASV